MGKDRQKTPEFARMMVSTLQRLNSFIFQENSVLWKT